jgi:hypothetical protein
VKPPQSEIKVATRKSYERHVRVHLLTDPIADMRLLDIGKSGVEDCSGGCRGRV